MEQTIRGCKLRDGSVHETTTSSNMANRTTMNKFQKHDRSTASQPAQTMRNQTRQSFDQYLTGQIDISPKAKMAAVSRNTQFASTVMNQTTAVFTTDNKALQSNMHISIHNSVMKQTCTTTLAERFDQQNQQNMNFQQMQRNSQTPSQRGQQQPTTNNWLRDGPPQPPLPNTGCRNSTGHNPSERHYLSSGGSVTMSIDGARPSIISEGLGASNLMAVRIPYRASLGDHNQMRTQTQEEIFKARAQREIRNYSVGKHTPMSPIARQSIALDKITLLTLKARGKLLPGQPTAKQYAEILRQQRADFIPDQYGDTNTPFVHNSTFKPITAYRFNKFKDMHKMRGINLDKGVPDKRLAEKLQRKRSMAGHEKNMLSFKDNSVKLYSKEDKEKIANRKGAKTEQDMYAKETEVCKDRTISSEEDESEKDDKLEINPSAMTQESAGFWKFKQMVEAERTGNLAQPRKKMYDLYGGIKNPQEFLNKLQKKIEQEPPEVNISDIVEQFYNREPFCGYSPESNKLIFRETLNRENEEAFNLRKSKQELDNTPIFKLTNDSVFNNTSPAKGRMSAIAEEPAAQEAPMKMFSLHRYKLPQMQEAYKAYKDARKGIIYAAKAYKKFLKLREGETVEVTCDQIIAEIRKNPDLAHVADIIEDPMANSLMNMLITYEKYNYQTEEQGISKAINQSLEFQETEGMFADHDEPMFKEIELMKELVLEFGDAISTRIRDIEQKVDQPASTTPRQNITPRGGQQSSRHLTENESPRDSVLKGEKLRSQAKNQNYLMVNKMIVEHPEFEFIKNQAKQRVLERVNQYKATVMSRLSSVSLSPVRGSGKKGFRTGQSVTDASSPAMSKGLRSSYRSMTLDSESPLMQKQREISKPRRRLDAPRSRLQFQQFVQSDVFQETFNGLITQLDVHHGSRKMQTTQAAAQINQQTFYKLAKDSISTNMAENPNVEFMNECYKQGVVPFPVFSKVRNSTLILIDYHLNEGYSRAMEKYFLVQTSYESLIDALVLHGNALEDKAFAHIINGLSKNSKLRHLHYGMNQLGELGNKSLLKLLELPFPNQLHSLVLTNLRTTGKASKKDDLMSIQSAAVTSENDIVAVPEGQGNFKNSIPHQLVSNLIQTESLMKLVLQDMPLGPKTQQNLVLFVEKNQKLENLQLINCQMTPEALSLICIKLEEQIELQCISFRKNVLRRHPKAPEFADNLTRLVAAAPALMHLDISAMFLGDAPVKKIMMEGAAESKTLAAVHLQDNQVNHWSRIQIFHAMTRPKVNKSDLKYYANGNADPTAADNLDRLSQKHDSQASINLDELQPVDSSNIDISQNASYFEDRDMHVIANDHKDKKLDKDIVDIDLCLQNIGEMIKAKMPIVQFMDSQEIIDAEQLKDNPGENLIVGVQGAQVPGGLADELRGTLYNRLSNEPTLFHDKVERTQFFSSSQWLSVSHLAGCWICNSKKIMDRKQRKGPSETFARDSTNTFLIRTAPLI